MNALYGKEHPNYPAYVYLLAPISLAVLNPIANVFLEIGELQNKEAAVVNTDQNRNIPKIERSGKF